jgi:cyclin-dependent kinase 10
MLTSVSHETCPIPSAFKGSCRSVECYEKLNRIGEGTYGIVYRAKEKESGKIYALKRVRMDAEADGLPISSIREINLLKSLCHTNIINVLDVVVGKQLDHIFLVMEYCDYDLAYIMDFLIQNNPNSTFPIPIGKYLV